MKQEFNISSPWTGAQIQAHIKTMEAHNRLIKALIFAVYVTFACLVMYALLHPQIIMNNVFLSVVVIFICSGIITGLSLSLSKISDFKETESYPPQLINPQNPDVQHYLQRLRSIGRYYLTRQEIKELLVIEEKYEALQIKNKIIGYKPGDVEV
ncbi:hypothetical protein Selin_1451 [Desulfurispirillum indicum S5]|uniref:Uncharacterized protein n=1 Tax=Desulfurispirillum indicum (strain ATCC BAA-1389 / DSM 22839 / S5) TaxID=653733 RepID=E6W6U2_DESIS|nr:hypothetical protein [Desulfurispirillum indicum]ADU66185.1 hypothetical protein Selin_1451 [Desulfurispirillum indicum S5]